MKKRSYETPEIDITEFGMEDVVRTSGGDSTWLADDEKGGNDIFGIFESIWG